MVAVFSTTTGAAYEDATGTIRLPWLSVGVNVFFSTQFPSGESVMIAVPPEGIMLRPSSASVANVHLRPFSSRVSISTKPYKSDALDFAQRKGNLSPAKCQYERFRHDL